MKNAPAALKVEIPSLMMAEAELIRVLESSIYPGAKLESIKLEDLGKAKKGEDVFYVNKDDIKLPYGLSAMNVTPASVKVKLDATASRTVLVKPVLTGEPRHGFFVSSVRVEPETVGIRGLMSDVRKLHIVNTEPLDITDSDGTMTQELNIDTGGIKVTPDIETVKVIINISRKRK